MDRELRESIDYTDWLSSSLSTLSHAPADMVKVVCCLQGFLSRICTPARIVTNFIAKAHRQKMVIVSTAAFVALLSRLSDCRRQGLESICLSCNINAMQHWNHL